MVADYRRNDEKKDVNDLYEIQKEREEGRKFDQSSSLRTNPDAVPCHLRCEVAELMELGQARRVNMWGFNNGSTISFTVEIDFLRICV